MKPEEVKVASVMSNIGYNTIQKIATYAEMDIATVQRIIKSFVNRGLVESISKGSITAYRLK